MQPLLKIFLPLYLAHLLADFPLQTSWMVQNKRKVAAILAHAAIHYAAGIALLALFATGSVFVPRTLCAVGLLVVIHLTLDETKCWMTRVWPDNYLLFLADQLLHLVTVGAAALYLANTRIAGILNSAAISEPARQNILVIAIVYVGVIFAGGYLIRYLTKSLAGDVDSNGKQSGNLRNAGLYIGWLERFLFLTAIVVQSPAIVGLILTGKSIARFPELKEPRFAEYFLIGTFLSLSLAMIGGLVLARLLWGTASLK
jgi:hypothetical protein